MKKFSDQIIPLNMQNKIVHVFVQHIFFWSHRNVWEQIEYGGIQTQSTIMALFHGIVAINV